MIEVFFIVMTDITQNSNDKKELMPTLESIENLPDELLEGERILFDIKYYSEANVTACEDAGITPFIAPGWIPYYPVLTEYPIAPESQVEGTVVEKMKRRLKTKEDRKIFSRRRRH
jgi:hypothetical protein